MIDNFDIVEPLLKWRSDDDFYFIQVIQRKKDHKDGTRVNGTNNNSRLIKAYYVRSLESLQFYKPEIIELCKVFNARAGINLNRRSFKKTQLKFLKKIVDQLENGMECKGYKAYSSVVGASHNDNEKKWIVDVDEEELSFIPEIRQALTGCQPNLGEDKVIAKIPSKTGVHLITSPFNRKDFPNLLNELTEPYQIQLSLAIQTNNPTNLYIP